MASLPQAGPIGSADRPVTSIVQQVLAGTSPNVPLSTESPRQPRPRDSSVLHVAETLQGGPAAYLDEAIPHQLQTMRGVHLLVPDVHQGYLEAAAPTSVRTFVRTGRNARSLLRLFIALSVALREIQPDIVHAHSSYAGLMVRLACWLSPASPTVIYCAHCWSFDRPVASWSTRLFARIERLLASATDSIVSISPHETQLLKAKGFALDNVDVVVSGIADTDTARSTSSLSTLAAARQGPLRILYVGRTDPQKGFDLLIEEFRSISRSRAILTVAGAKVIGSGRTRVPSSVQLVGWLPRDEIQQLIAQADAVVMPSRWEGMPLVALEVMRAGKVLLGSDTGPFPHLIDHGKTGFLMDIGRPGFVSRALMSLETTDLKALGDAARRKYLHGFTARQMNVQLLVAYQRALVRRARRRPSRLPQATVAGSVDAAREPVRSSASAQDDVACLSD